VWLPSLDHRQGQTGHRREIFEGRSKESKEHEANKDMVVVPYVKGLSEAFIRILKSHGIATARPLTVFTERYGTLWFIRRTRSRMSRRPIWSIVCFARTAPGSSSYIGETGRVREKPDISSLSSLPSPTLTLRLEVTPLGSAVLLRQRGLGRIPNRKQFWCILALKSVIWWEQF